MIEREVSRAKAARTIYDDRAELLERISGTEYELDHYEKVVHQVKLTIQCQKKELAQINLAITRELELDAQR